MRSFLLFVASLASSLSFGQNELDEKLPEALIPELKTVIDSALQNSDTVLDRQLAEREAYGKRMSARSAVLPSLGTNVAVRQEKDDDTDGEAGFEDRVIYNVTLSQPLYHWGSKRSQKQIGELGYGIEKLNTAIALESLASRIRSAYLNLVIVKQNLEASEKMREEQQAKYDFMLSQVESGRAGESSLQSQELSLARSELSELTRLNDWESKLDDLAQLSGLDVVTLAGLIVSEIPQFEVISEETVAALETYFDSSLQNDEGLQKLELDLEIEQKRLRMEEVSLRPKIDARVGMSSNALDVDGTRREQAYSYFGLSVSWSIFDGFSKKGSVIESLNRLNRKEHSKKLYEEKLLRSWKLLISKLDIQRRALAIEERALLVATGRVEWFEGEYEAGRVPKSDLDKASREFQNASTKAQSSRSSYLLALSELMTELGIDPLSQ
ncbi:TolC family protein [Pelagicoccus albus]|uniref:TolC family protein n=1 Tax=Pelagicoccus albus TaxID=415222 RepID=A0A7X1E6U4_9BACT|nr:TolC family protein [Pelagicoccus albus]MBC2605075.1 TolC family protein [Pelagicoccus albus]